MISRFRQFRALAGLTALEAMRQPLFLLLTASCVAATALAPLVLMHQFGEEGRLARDGGLAFHFVFGLFVAGYTACVSLSREMRHGTAAAVLSKPVGRAMFFLAKFAGVACVVIAFSFCATLATLMAERVSERFMLEPGFTGFVTDTRLGVMLAVSPLVAFLVAGFVNWRRGRPFESTAFGMLALFLMVAAVMACLFDRRGQWAPFDPLFQFAIVPASLLITLALLTLAALALALSTRLGVTPTLTLLSTLFLLGLMSDHWFGTRAAGNPLFGALYRLLPNWQHFWMSDALSEGGSISVGYGVQAAIYGALYVAGVLCLGGASFYGADVESRG